MRTARLLSKKSLYFGGTVGLIAILSFMEEQKIIETENLIKYIKKLGVDIFQCLISKILTY